MTSLKVDVKWSDPDIRSVEVEVYRDDVHVELLVTNEGNYHKIFLAKSEVEAIMSKILELDRF